MPPTQISLGAVSDMIAFGCGVFVFVCVCVCRRVPPFILLVVNLARSPYTKTLRFCDEDPSVRDSVYIVSIKYNDEAMTRV